MGFRDPQWSVVLVLRAEKSPAGRVYSVEPPRRVRTRAHGAAKCPAAWALETPTVPAIQLRPGGRPGMSPWALRPCPQPRTTGSTQAGSPAERVHSRTEEI